MFALFDAAVIVRDEYIPVMFVVKLCFMFFCLFVLSDDFDIDF